jgi:hypothetical protein
MVLTSFDATPASSATTVHNMDDFVPVLPLAMQVEGNPQKEHNSHTNIYCIHSLLFLSYSCKNHIISLVFYAKMASKFRAMPYKIYGTKLHFS